MRDLPPLHALPAFEAAARLGSFLAAAEALHLTPSAISHRIRLLETHLGQPLFERRHRAVALTAAGRRYLAVVRDSLFRLDEASALLRAPRRERLRLSAAPALGSQWLVGRIAAYQEQHPDLEFVIGSATGLGPLLTGEADIGVRYGEEEWPGLLAWKLFEEHIFPVCRPALAEQLKTPADLDHQRLLRHPLLSWSRWFAATGLKRDEPAHGPLYEDARLMLEGAIAGHGVALMAASLAAPYLAAGRLARPFVADCPDRSFYIVAPPAIQERPATMAFIRWLVQGART
ncbi:LysR substrate-binding domain-containing protein [Azonexus sp.]|jgi:LysR family glycine cleavage system transcriptional activator|uniref:LysR substrate-binding domain-containing protein n=1 Tax=Azonexus sp. TaxID=1872668 RepID=UPI00281E6A41|nr:LysR substrate-binding domain-containing protein [Azonexus sp.]MDR1994098.1 LysR family transcriptional regulator [Azonexus sp.]